jgi:hypothetical protein
MASFTRLARGNYAARRAGLPYRIGQIVRNPRDAKFGGPTGGLYIIDSLLGLYNGKLSVRARSVDGTTDMTCSIAANNRWGLQIMKPWKG